LAMEAQAKIAAVMAAPVAEEHSAVDVSPPRITQVDMILLDISGSMKATSVLDVLKTREDMSKLLFHTMVDKLVGLEMNHAVGLLAFGADLHPVPITREYERFHDHLGRMDAREGSTKLFDAILEAAKIMLQYSRDASNFEHSGEERTHLRIFALTDGEDNASVSAAWQVTQFLQQHNIVLDAFPLAGDNPTLRAMASATSGLCLRVTSEEQGLALFEREAVLHIPSRETLATPPIPIHSSLDLASLAGAAIAVEDVKAAVPAGLSQPVLTVTEALQKFEISSRSGTAALRRVMKEFSDFNANPVPGWLAFVGADNPMVWKAIMQGPASSVYEGGNWLVSVQFPVDYPFKPPRVRFVTRIYHCNINNDGGVCLDILKDAWSPALTITKIFASLTSLVSEPNPDDALDAFKAQVYRTDRARYLAEAREWVAKHAAADATELVANSGSK